MNNQLSLEQLQKRYGNLTISNVNQKSEFESMKELSRGPGTSCHLRYNDPNGQKVVLKYADFKVADEANNIKGEAEVSIPIINRQTYTQKVIDYKISRSTFQAIYEYIDGEDLHQYMVRKKAEGSPITYQEAAGICLDVWEIIEPLHQKRVAHRNIKMANVIRRKADQKLILGDFNFGCILQGKMHFGVQFNEKMGMHNLCLEPDANTNTQIPFRLLGKKLSIGYFTKLNPTNYIKMGGLENPVPEFVEQQIRYLTEGDSLGNRQPFSEAIKVFSTWAKREMSFQKISFENDQKIINSAKSDISFQKITMIHPCGKIDDGQFYNYMNQINSKKQNPFEKIQIHFGGNQITSKSFNMLTDMLNGLNTTKLKNLSINMNFNKLESILNFVKLFDQTNFPCLEKLTLGFNQCLIENENVILMLDVLKKKEFQNLKKLFIDFRGNQQETDTVSSRIQELNKISQKKIKIYDKLLKRLVLK